MATQIKMPSNVAAYMRFLQLAAEISFVSGSFALDANDGALLDALALHWFEGEPLAVREAMALNTLGSPSTLHRRISRLKAVGLIEQQSSPKSLRIKLLVPAKKAMTFFDKLGGAVIKAAKVDR